MKEKIEEFKTKAKAKWKTFKEEWLPKIAGLVLVGCIGAVGGAVGAVFGKECYKDGYKKGRYDRLDEICNAVASGAELVYHTVDGTETITITKKI